MSCGLSYREIEKAVVIIAYYRLDAERRIRQLMVCCLLLGRCKQASDLQSNPRTTLKVGGSAGIFIDEASCKFPEQRGAGGWESMEPAAGELGTGLEGGVAGLKRCSACDSSIGGQRSVRWQRSDPQKDRAELLNVEVCVLWTWWMNSRRVVLSELKSGQMKAADDAKTLARNHMSLKSIHRRFSTCHPC